MRAIALPVMILKLSYLVYIFIHLKDSGPELCSCLKLISKLDVFIAYTGVLDICICCVVAKLSICSLYPSSHTYIMFAFHSKNT